MHAVDRAPAVHPVEAVEQVGLEEPPALRLATGEHAVDRAAQRVGRAGGIGRAARQELRRVAEDREAHALDVARLAVGAGEGRQVGAMAELPLHLGQREAAVLEEAGALLDVARVERLAARAVVEGDAVDPAAVGHVDQQRAVALRRIGRHQQHQVGGVLDLAALVAPGLVEVGNLLGRVELAMHPALPQHIVTRLERAVGLLARDLEPDHLGGSGAGPRREQEQRGGQQLWTDHAATLSCRPATSSVKPGSAVWTSISGKRSRSAAANLGHGSDTAPIIAWKCSCGG